MSNNKNLPRPSHQLDEIVENKQLIIVNSNRKGCGFSITGYLVKEAEWYVLRGENYYLSFKKHNSIHKINNHSWLVYI